LEAAVAVIQSYVYFSMVGKTFIGQTSTSHKEKGMGEAEEDAYINYYIQNRLQRMGNRFDILLTMYHYVSQ
jgi:hypothetical protein